MRKARRVRSLVVSSRAVESPAPFLEARCAALSVVLDMKLPVRALVIFVCLPVFDKDLVLRREVPAVLDFFVVFFAIFTVLPP